MRALVIALLLVGMARADVSVPEARPGTPLFELARARAVLIASERTWLRMQRLQSCGSLQALTEAEDEYLRARREFERAAAAAGRGR